MSTRGWQWLFWALLVAWVTFAVLEATGFGPYAIRAYGADLAVPAWLYIVLRSLDNPNRRRVIRRHLGRTPQTAAGLLFAASTATELSQRFVPNGPFPGTFDPRDIASFGVGIAIVYWLDRRTPLRADFRKRNTVN
ncbi:MAG: hypothetical protein P3B98_01210 [Gemmatimonadota bacterium]|nr:hypothetical protein [Gemmatimonadota bacterium]